MSNREQEAAELTRSGNALAKQGDLAGALKIFARAAGLAPHIPETLNNLGYALICTGNPQGAVPILQNAVKLADHRVEFHSHLALALELCGLDDQALDHFMIAARLQPGLCITQWNLGLMLENLGRRIEARECFHRALQIDPNSATAHWYLSMSLLLEGNFQAGWRAYEYRWGSERFPSRRRNFHQPQWEGSPLHGKTILLYSEQGFGDTLQFIRFVSMVGERGGRLIVQVPPELLTILISVPGVSQWIAEDEALPPFDFHASLMSLPYVLGIGVTDIPAVVPYIDVGNQAMDRWREKVSVLNRPGILRIGLAWAGRPKHINDRRRSLPAEFLDRFAEFKDIQFYSLQKWKAAGPLSLRLIDHTDQIVDFSDSAALISQLDLIISVDTAIAHLAGALGKPVWVLLPFAPDWRWLLDRTDSPWYPTMRLYRQPAPRDWESVMRAVVSDLRNVGKPHYRL